MAYWNNLANRKKQLIQGFGKGINTFNDPLSLANNELLDDLNMCADSYPSIEVRPNRTLLAPASSSDPLLGLGIRTRNSTGGGASTSNEIHRFSGTSTGASWKYTFRGASTWAIITSTLKCANPSVFVEANTMTARYIVLAHSSGSTQYNCYWDGATFSTFASTASPRSNLLTAHRYRLYGIDYDKRLLRYSAQSDITDWTTAEDAGWIDLTDIGGEAVAITTFNNHVIIWSDSTMFELYGSSVDNFELVDISKKIGCIGRKAYVECDGNLYWMDYHGIYMYTGGKPRQIAFQAQKYIDGINPQYAHLVQGGSVKGKAYFAIPSNGATSNDKVIVIDVRNLESEGGFVVVNIEDKKWDGFINDKEILIGHSSDGNLYNMNSTIRTGIDGTSNPIAYSFDLKPLYDEGFKINTHITDVVLQHEGSTGTLNAYYWDNKNFATTSYSTISFSSERSGTNIMRSRLLMSISQLKSADIFKFRFSGLGYKKFHGLHIGMLSYGDDV